MSAHVGRIAIRGSTRKSVPRARLVQKSDPDKTIEVSIFARRNPSPPPDALARANAIKSAPVAGRSYLGKEEFNEVYGAARADLDAIVKFAESAGLVVVESSIAKRRVLVKGPI